MGYNLTNERIQDTYEQLLQISGSTIVDGTGSVAPVSIASASYADFAVTASYAQNAGDIDTSSLVSNDTFNAYTSSNDASVTSLSSSTSASIADINNQIAALEAGSGSADWDLITNKPSGLVSSSAQTLKNVSGSVITPSTVTAGVVSAATLIAGQGIFSGNISGTSLNATNLTASNALVSGDLAVNGTASFGYLQTVTGSATIIGDAFVVVNSDTPTQRYAGIKVYDSGSPFTASFFYDGVTNDWNYEYSGSDDTNFGVALFGPEYSTQGSPSYPSNNVIQKGNGGHHLVDSIMSDDGSQVLVSGSVSASAYYGDGSNLTGVTTTLENGSGGTRSIVSVNVTPTDAISQAQGGIAIGDSAQINNAISTDAIVIGRDSAARGIRAIGIGYGAGSGILADADYSIGIGSDASPDADYAIAIGSNTSVTSVGGVTIGDNTSAGNNAVKIGRNGSASTLAVAVGYNASANNQRSVAIGVGSSVNGDYGVALGFNASVGNISTVGIGHGATSTDHYSVAVGRSTSAGYKGTAVGDEAVASGQNSVAVGVGTSATATNEVNVGGIFKYDGTSDITLSGSLVKLADSASSSGSLIDNYHPAIASGSPQIQHIVTIDQTAYDTISGSGNVSNDTLYIISDAGDNVYPDNLQVQGQIYSPTFAGSIASSTSSVDFNNGNFATLDCSAGATFLANPSNLQSGTTYTIIITSGSNISNHGTAWKFAGGTAPTYTDGTDVLTCVSDGTSLYATALTDFQ